MSLVIIVRDRAELLARLEIEQRQASREIIKTALTSPLNIPSLISSIYDTGISRAIMHRPNGALIERLETALWVAQIDLDLAKYSWFQFGLPKLEAVAQVLELPWPEHPKLKLMVKGKKCGPICTRCSEER